MSDFVNTIDLLGDEAVTKGILEKTISEFRDNKITKIGSYAFFQCERLENVDLPNASTIGRSAFGKCTALKDFSTNKISNYSGYTFIGCTSLKSVDISATWVYLGSHEFSGCAELESVNIPHLQSNSGTNLFDGCTKLKSVSFPNYNKILANTFTGCSSLVDVYLPKATEIWDSAFSGCTSLKHICLQAATRFSNTHQFNNCTSLESVDFPVMESIDRWCFNGCSALKLVILRKEAVAYLRNVNTFDGTPFIETGTGGTVLVPASQVAGYGSNTNWSAILAQNANNRVLALEDYTVDGTITGAIDWDKLGGTT